MQEEFALQNRIVLITGGSSGIGLAIAQSFVRAGARVAITGRNAGMLEESRNLTGEP